MLPDASSGEPRPKSFDPVSVLAAAATFLILLVLAEAASRLAVRTGFWYSRFDFAGTVTSLPELEERVAWAASRPRPLFVLGDSVLGASALLEHGVASPRRSTLAARLAEREAARGRHVESLAADGMLLPDLEAESRLLGPGRPRVLVVLNFRMFAGEFQQGSKALSRDFLSTEPPRERALPEWAFRHSALLRSTAMLKSLWYFPTRRDFFRRTVERVVGSDSDPEIQEAALRLKVAPYYRDRWSASSPAFRALEVLLRDLSAQAAGSGPVAVVLTPQNPDFVEDAELFAANRAVLGEFVRSRGIAGLEFRDWADRFSADRFLDHCHLTAEGNRDYAVELARWIDP